MRKRGQVSEMRAAIMLGRVMFVVLALGMWGLWKLVQVLPLIGGQ